MIFKSIMTFYKFVVDTTIFNLSYSSIQFTVFGRIIDEPVSLDRVNYDGIDTFNVDADVDSFTLLVSTMRGYTIDMNNLSINLRSKYDTDFNYFIKQRSEQSPPVFEFINSKYSDTDSDSFY